MSDQETPDAPRPDRATRREDERVAEVVGHLLAADAEGVLWRDPRFLAWLVAEAREHDRAVRRRTDDQLAAQGRVMLERVRARKLGVCRRVSEPRIRPPSVVGNPSDVLTLAWREHAAPVVELSVAAGVGRELWEEPVEGWLELPADAPPGQYLALKVTGGSMAPLMHTGDTLLVRIGADVERDTVIVARHPDDGYVCKRVGDVRGEAIELVSLEAGRPAITIPRDPRLILGTVLMVWCAHGAG